MNLKVIYEDKEIIVCYKPAGLATQTASLGSPDMVSMIKNYLAKQGKDTSDYVGLIHRLDQPVSGLLVFAKTKKAAAELSKQIQGENANKDYIAFCHGVPREKEGTLVHYIAKDPVAKKAGVMDEQEFLSAMEKSANENKKQNYKKAVLNYEVVEEREDNAILKIHLQTGRFHQIRAQFSAMGNTLLGDEKYGNRDSKESSRRKNINKIALCAYRLKIKHPNTGKELEFLLEEELLPDWYKSR